MSFDSTATADTDVDQTETFHVLHTIGFIVDGPLSAETVAILDAYTKALQTVRNLDGSGIISSHTVAHALLDVLKSLQGRQLGVPVAESLSHPQLVQVASLVFANKVNQTLGGEIAQTLKSHVLVPVVADYFADCIAKAIAKTEKQHALDMIKKQLRKALSDPAHSEIAPVIRRVLDNLREAATTFVNDDDTDVTDILTVIHDAVTKAMVEEFESRMGHDAHGHGHFGFPEGFPRTGVVFDRSDRQGRHDF